MNVLQIALRSRAYARLAPLARPDRARRVFSSTSRLQASEDTNSFMASFRNSPLFNQIAENPEAIAALGKVAQYLKDNNIDLSSSPSTMTLFQLGTNPEFRKIAREAMAEMRKAGVEIKPENAMELFSPPKDPKGPK